MSYIYIAPLKDKSSFKIGKSSHPLERISTLSKYYEFDLDGILVMDCNSDSRAFDIEHAMHLVLAKSRIRLEHDGGTEFFEYDAFGYAVILAEAASSANLWSLEKLDVDEDIQPMGTFLDLTLSAMGRRCADRRLEMNVSQIGMARKAKLGVRTVQRLESGQSVHSACLIKLMHALEMECEFSDSSTSTRKRASNHK